MRDCCCGEGRSGFGVDVRGVCFAVVRREGHDSDGVDILTLLSFISFYVGLFVSSWSGVEVVDIDGGVVWCGSR
jgi:hypothetical protein